MRLDPSGDRSRESTPLTSLIAEVKDPAAACLIRTIYVI